MKYTTLTFEEQQSEALQQIKNIFDKQIIPLLVQSNQTEIQLNNCLKNYCHTGINIQFILNLKAVEKSDQQIKDLHKLISDYKENLQ